jgi:hypothetical protein
MSKKQHDSDHSNAAAAPKTNGSQNLYKGMLLIVAFAVISLGFSAVSTLSRQELAQSNVGKERILQDFLEQGRQSVRRRKEWENEAETVISDGEERINESVVLGDSKTHPPYHIVFSTSCNDQQNWESYVFFYHANKVKQPGTVTRICSGCNDKEAKQLQEFHNKYIKPLNKNFYLHLTPDFSSLTRQLRLGEKKAYKYMNKPYGLRHWMENVLKMNETHSPETEDGIVMLMDPDMILLRPLVHDFTNEDVIFVQGAHPRTKVVKHGYPMAQHDGYLDNHWMSLNISYVTNGGNINHIKGKDGPIFWNTGPPYLATVRDMYQIAVLWCEYAPRGTNVTTEFAISPFTFGSDGTNKKLSHLDILIAHFIAVYDIFPKLFAEMVRALWLFSYFYE